MIVDLNHDGVPPRSSFDACICGAGPAGITIARTLASRGWHVLLLEAGGHYYTKESQELYDADCIGLEAWVNLTRLRFLGGTSNHWAGRCRPFEAFDFLREPPLDLPGWPITIDAIAGYQRAALEILDIKSAEPFTRCENPDLSPYLIADCDEKSLPTRFSTKYKEELASSQYITLLLNANASDLRVRAGTDSIDRVTFMGYDGTAHVAQAGVFFLAMGAVENARFLLDCTEDVPVGLGNEYGMVGMGFMEHFNVPFGEFVSTSDPENFRMSLFTSDAFLDSQRLVGRSNVNLSILKGIKSYGRTAAIKTYFKNLACKWGFAEELQFLTEFDCPGTGVITSLTEQFPSRSSYVELSERIDRFGHRQPRLNWVMSSGDRESIRQIGIQLGKDYVDAGLGAIRLAPGVLDSKLPLKVDHHAHHMGTTRMAARPADGVIDQNCKVFGLANLYVAGSSIFSTGAACNPTMPLLQFALRLSDHIVERSSN
jgi:choline dehydrogenase-like flavoprotein